MEAGTRRWRWTLALLLAVCVGRFWVAPLASSFWVDETVTAFVVARGGDHWSLAVAPQVPQSIYYALPAALRALGGGSEAAYRLPSVAAMGLALFFCARIAARLIHPEAGWVVVMASFLLRGFSDAATDARPYALGLCVASLSVWALIRWLDDGHWRDGALFVGAAALLWPTHLIYWPFYLVYPLYAGARLWRRESAVGWAKILGSFAVLGALLLPVAWRALALAQDAGAHVIVPTPDLRGLKYALKFGLALSAVPGAWILHRVLRTPVRPWPVSAGLLVLGWWFVHPFCLFGYSVLTGNSVFLPRYLSLAWPGILLGTAYLAARWMPERAWRPVAVFAGVWALAHPAGRPWTGPAHGSDWRGAAAAIAALHDPAIPVVCPSPFVEAKAPEWRPDYPLPGFLYAHLDRYPVAGRPLLLPFERTEAGLHYAGRLAETVLPAAGRFVIYGGDRNVWFWRRWFSLRPELAGWQWRRLGSFGDVEAVLMERPSARGGFDRQSKWAGDEVFERVSRRSGRPAAGGGDRADHHAAVGDYGGLRRADPLDYPQWHRPDSAGECGADPRSGVPGVRDSVGDDRPGAGDCGAAGRDLLLVRRHAAGAGQRAGPVPGKERGGRRPGGVFAAGRGASGAPESGAAGGVFRHRV